MFGNDDGGDDDGLGLGEVLFGLWLWRQMDSGRMDAGGVFKAGCLILALLGGGLLILLVIASASVPRYSGSFDYSTPYSRPTEAPFVAPAWTPRPAPTPAPTATPSPTPTPTPIASARRSRPRTAGGCGWTRSSVGGRRGMTSPAGG